MPSTTDLISPKQAARALGVSESSLKRWCDRGLLQAVRTAGGHRKLPTADVLRFVREHQHRVIAPEVLGLPPTSEGAELGLTRGGLRLAEALLAGDEESARRIVFDLYLAKHSIAAIGDGVMARAFREIGDRWACKEAEIYQERHGCEIVLRILHELRRSQMLPPGAPRAVGATLSGDPYSLPLTLAETVLRSVGFEAIMLGTSIPIESLLNAVRDLQPRLFFISVSHVIDEERVVEEFARLSAACQAQGTALVAGGRMLSESLRPRLNYSAYCDTLQQLESFAAALARPSKRPRRSTTVSRTNTPRS